jgi:hypothetical protein
MMREPVARALSAYAFIWSRAVHPLHAQLHCKTKIRTD